MLNWIQKKMHICTYTLIFIYIRIYVFNQISIIPGELFVHWSWIKLALETQSSFFYLSFIRIFLTTDQISLMVMSSHFFWFLNHFLEIYIFQEDCSFHLNFEICFPRVIFYDFEISTELVIMYSFSFKVFFFSLGVYLFY